MLLDIFSFLCNETTVNLYYIYTKTAIIAVTYFPGQLRSTCLEAQGASLALALFKTNFPFFAIGACEKSSFETANFTPFVRTKTRASGKKEMRGCSQSLDHVRLLSFHWKKKKLRISRGFFPTTFLIQWELCTSTTPGVAKWVFRVNFTNLTFPTKIQFKTSNGVIAEYPSQAITCVGVL